jgi:hypothetical protein
MEIVVDPNGDEKNTTVMMGMVDEMSSTTTARIINDTMIERIIDATNIINNY